MVGMFGGFASGKPVMFQQVGFGLAVAVILDATMILDATIVRSVLVPASMTLLGDRNWYLPPWLGWLPNVHVEDAPAVRTPAVIAAPADELRRSVRGCAERIALPERLADTPKTRRTK